MLEQKKKLRLDELQVESFVTNTPSNDGTVKGGNTTVILFTTVYVASYLIPGCSLNPNCGVTDTCPGVDTDFCGPSGNTCDPAYGYTCDGGFACGDSRAIC